ncbi:hypothetical protein BDN72DRAFT_760067 [Pluteus cervinus]|uniref:Uncharacterized protein n=1 Tax=Pluteus cervinus TaxID=181527 RepID=A0ACD3B889_9AGAR|nr:hypothetical protein BDN72DRAFT_760067 [Pluteus cervinus]
MVLAISMMIFTRNSTTNLFPLILGLFFEIGGTSSRVINTLSNAGASVSVSTIERLKKILSDDAKRHAVELMKSDLPFFNLLDNINIFLRKSEQRLFNKNTMLNATNVVIIGLPNATPEAEDLQQKLASRGKRSLATGEDILPTEEDNEKMFGSFEGLIIQFIVAYCPGSEKWGERQEMMDYARTLMAKDRPLEPTKTDTRPLGVFDVNEGSKMGMIKVLKAIQEASGLTEEQWSGKTRIIAGDWLTASNFRGARRDRSSDVDSMERLEYGEELSQLFHFALNATHMLMRLHFGNAILDPGSLAKHKGLLNRTWDAAKPNYADGKALIRHSLIARVLYSIMCYANPVSALNAKKFEDDVAAHLIYFIRDALIFCEFEDAVSHADAGRVLRVLKFWAFSFRGAGLHNYARECLEIVLRWKYELTPSLQAALEQSWFVNRWGLSGRWIASDLYLEQLNFWVKVCYQQTRWGICRANHEKIGFVNVDSVSLLPKAPACPSITS